MYLIFLSHLSLSASLHDSILSIPFHASITVSDLLSISTFGWFFLVLHRSRLEVLHLSFLLRFPFFIEMAIVLELIYSLYSYSLYSYTLSKLGSVCLYLLYQISNSRVTQIEKSELVRTSIHISLVIISKAMHFPYWRSLKLSLFFSNDSQTLEIHNDLHLSFEFIGKPETRRVMGGFLFHCKCFTQL